MKTLNGFLLEDLADLLDQPLHKNAYKPITGATYLTDISIVWQRRVFNKIFGIYSIGWGFDVNPDHIVTTEGSTVKGKPNYETSIKGLFWFKYIKNGKELKSEFLVTGAHKDSNGNLGYSMKGAFTNAIGFGGSCLGWQESVYMGERSHSSPKTSAPARKIFKSLQEMMSLKVEDEPEKTTAPITKVEKPVEKTTIPVVKEDFTKTAMKTLFFNCSKCGGILKIKSNTDKVKENCPDCKVEMIVAKDEAQCLDRQSLIKEELKAAAVKQKPSGMIYPVCLECGYLEPVNQLPDVCKGCGICRIDNGPKVFSIQANLETAQKMSKSLTNPDKKEKQDSELLNDAKLASGSSRGYLLQCATEISGKKITSYAAISNALLHQIIEAEKENEPETENPVEADRTVELAKIGKTDKIKQIYKSACVHLGSVTEVVSAISKKIGRKITSSNDLNQDELNDIYVAWVMEGKKPE